MKKESTTRGEAAAACNDQAVEALERLMGQLAGILDATMRETWLPMGFRTRLVEEFPLLRELAVAEEGGLGALRSHVSHLRKVGDRYSGVVKESEALKCLRAFEEELRVLERADS